MSDSLYPNRTTDPNQPVQSWVERNGFKHWGFGLMWLFTALLPMQFIILIGVFIVLVLTGSIENISGGELESFFTQADFLISFNSAWQVLALAAGTLLVTKLHTSRENISQFLRLRAPTKRVMLSLIAVMLIIVMQPMVWFLGYINSFLPAPDVLTQMQADQMQLIQSLMQGQFSVLFILFNIAVVPAFCEEIMFRGYIMRTFEKHTTIFWAILFSSIIFGLFHLQITHFLPLSFIGGVLALLAYGSNSLLPAIVAHFTNNALSVVVATQYPESELASISPSTAPPIWLVLISMVFTGLIITFLVQQLRSLKQEEQREIKNV